MKKKPDEFSDELRPEYDLRKLKFVGRGIYAKRKKIMSEGSGNRAFVFSVVEDDGENLTIEVSEEDYQKDLAAGVDEDAILKPGRYKMKRGGFLARHPELLKEKKRA